MPIYFIRAGSLGDVKIGVTSDVLKRLRGLQTSHPVKLRILRVLDGGASEEKTLHARFKDFRQTGEWFTFCPEMMTEDFGLPELPIPFSKKSVPRKGANGRRMDVHEEIAALIDLEQIAKRMGVPPWEVTGWCWISPKYYSAVILALRDLGYRHVSMSDLEALDDAATAERAQEQKATDLADKKMRRKWDEDAWLRRNSADSAWFPLETIAARPEPDNGDVAA